MSGLNALLGFTAWTLLLIFVVLVYRTSLVMTGRRAANAWTRGQARTDAPIFQRIEHAHANCLESLPLFAAIVLAAYLLEEPGVINALAPWVLVARVAQSITHAIGTTPTLVTIRATFFSAQLVLFAYMLWTLLVA